MSVILVIFYLFQIQSGGFNRCFYRHFTVPLNTTRCPTPLMNNTLKITRSHGGQEERGECRESSRTANYRAGCVWLTTGEEIVDMCL